MFQFMLTYATKAVLTVIYVSVPTCIKRSFFFLFENSIDRVSSLNASSIQNLTNTDNLPKEARAHGSKL